MIKEKVKFQNFISCSFHRIVLAKSSNFGLNFFEAENVFQDHSPRQMLYCSEVFSSPELNCIFCSIFNRQLRLDQLKVKVILARKKKREFEFVVIENLHKTNWIKGYSYTGNILYKSHTILLNYVNCNSYGLVIYDSVITLPIAISHL